MEPTDLPKPKPPATSQGYEKKTRPSSSKKERKSDGVPSSPYAPRDGSNLLSLQREDLINMIILMKKEKRMYESQISALKAENQRIDTESKQQHKRLEKLLEEQPQNTQAAHAARREVEKSVMVRELKALIRKLNQTIADRDAEIVELKRSMRHTVATELAIEKEEYYIEVLRLRKLLKEKTEALKKEKESREYERAMAVGKESDLKKTVDQMSRGCQELMGHLEVGTNKGKELKATTAKSSSKVIKTGKGPTGKDNDGVLITPTPIPTSSSNENHTTSNVENGKELKVDDIPLGDSSANIKDNGLELSFDEVREDLGVDTMEGIFSVPISGDNGLDSSVDVDLLGEDGGLDAKEGVFDDPGNGLDESVDGTVSKFMKGEKVEGRFRGGEKWYRCTIKSVDNLNGLYDLIYDDGDEERGIDESNIRKLEVN